MKKIILLFVIFLTSCTMNEHPSLLKDSSCELPCWNDITPGATTLSELLTTLKGIPTINQKSIKVFNSGQKFYDNRIDFSLYTHWLTGKPAIRVNTLLVSDRVVFLHFSGQIGSSFNDMVTKYGEPENIITVGSHNGKPKVYALLPRKGIAYISIIEKLELVEETPIIGVIIFQPSLYNTILESGIFSDGNYDKEQTLRIMQPWKGYGDIKEKYPIQNPTP